MEALVKVEPGNGSLYKQAITALITSDEFLSVFVAKFKPDFFEAPFARRICQWCVEFHEKYGTSPKSHIGDVFDEAVRGNAIDEDEVPLVEDLLNALSGSYDAGESLNVKFLLSQMGKLRDQQDVAFLRDELSNALDKGALDYAKELIVDYRESVALGDAVPLVKPFEDDVLDRVFAEGHQPLIRFPGAFGQLVNKLMTRAALVYLNAPAKAGKSQFLTACALLAARAGLNVAVFEAGDMTVEQYLRRLFVAMSGVPFEPYDTPHFNPCVDCARNQDDSCASVHRPSIGVSLCDGSGKQLPPQDWPSNYVPCDVCHKRGVPFPVVVHYKHYVPPAKFDADLVRRWQEIYKRRQGDGGFRLSPFSNNTLNVGGMDTILRGWREEDKFIPDVVICDYASILKWEDKDSGREERERINTRWKAARRMSQDWNCLFILADQCDTDGYKAEYQEMGNFSGSRTKNDHITGGIGLMRTDDEKKRCVARANVFAGRDIDCVASDQVVLLQDLSRGEFHLDSYWRRLEPQKKEEREERPRKKNYNKNYRG